MSAWTRVIRRGIALAVSSGACVLCGGGLLQAQEPVPGVPLKFKMLEAEDARPPRPVDSLAPLLEGLTSLPEIQAIAVRAFGRLERVDLVPRIAPLLRASTPAVRAEAANALGQAVVRADAAVVFDRLRARIPTETDASVRGVLARTIGRLAYRTGAEVASAEQALLSLLDPPAAATAAATGGSGTNTQAARSPAPTTVLGVAHGLEALARRTQTIQPLGAAARAWLASLARYGLNASGGELLTGAARDEGRRVRRLAVSALVPAGEVQEAFVRAVATDPDPQVRRLALLIVGRLELHPWVLDLVERALFDGDPRVRIEALRRRVVTGGRVACRAAKQAVIDDNDHVALVGLEMAGAKCEGDAEGVQLVDEIAVPPELDVAQLEWHRPAHALVALAQLTPDRTRPRLASFASHPSWLVRLYTARAAGLVGATTVLETLAADPNDNVADAALAQLVRRVGRRADLLLINALGRTDGQLVRNAARALAGTSRRDEATQALLVALARLTVELRDTSRDVRLALLERLEETGAKQPRVGDELTAYVHDFDPVVAARAAAIVAAWRGAALAAQPRLLPRRRLPSLELLDRLRHRIAVVNMVGGKTFRVRLFPDEAPTNVARFARLVSSGYFNGLTFHRVEPTFVIQGGSPNANEYAGDGPFTRDEVGLRSHLRGTVGISTRGRDTGDGQIFVNLVDNVRLDHNYTIIGEVIDGMDVVDRILEGDTIRRVALVSSH